MTMTENERSVVDSDEFTVRRTISIAAPIEKVWAAVTQADLISRWFGDRTILDRVEVGAQGTFAWDGYGDFPVRIEELDPPHTIAYRWGNDNTAATSLDPDNSTVFRFTLEAIAGGTQLTVVESGFDKLVDPAASMESNRGGWDSELDELVAYLEGGS
ncbi:SRPBCC family protein [Lacisediminihabitans sp. FW035]